MKKKVIAVLLALALLLAFLTAAEAWSNRDSIPVLDLFPEMEWDQANYSELRGMGLLINALAEADSDFGIWYGNGAGMDKEQIGYHYAPRVLISPEQLRRAMKYQRVWFVDHEVFSAEYLFRVLVDGKGWLMGVSEGEYLILLPMGKERILHFRDDGSLYRRLMKLIDDQE